MCVCLCLGGMLWVFAKVRKVLDRLELEIQVVGRHATWILESESWPQQKECMPLTTVSSLQSR